MAQSHQNSEVSKRYAKALFELVSGAKTESILNQLRKAEEVLVHPKISELLNSPILSKSERASVVDKVVTQIDLEQSIVNLIKLLAAKDRLVIFPEVVTSFETISDVQNKVLRGEVKSKEELSSDERAALEKRIKEFTGAQLILEYKRTDEILGGVTAQVGSFTFDGTLDTQLSKLREQVVHNN